MYEILRDGKKIMEEENEAYALKKYNDLLWDEFKRLMGSYKYGDTCDFGIRKISSTHHYIWQEVILETGLDGWGTDYKLRKAK